MAIIQKIENSRGVISTVEKNEDCRIYRSQDSTGSCEITVYPVFAGVELAYYDVHMQNFCGIPDAGNREMLTVTHCREGRIEYEYKNGEYMYLAAGDLSVQKSGAGVRSRCCPLSHYHGISVSMDMQRVPRCLSCILDDVFVNPEELEMKFCTAKPYTVMRGNVSIDHIFSELYNVPDNIRKGYIKVKTLELLLFLSGLDYRGENDERRYFSSAQVTAAKKAREYLLEHLDEHVTISRLADRLNVSPTTLKICFKGVYGNTINGYVTECKMQKAASLLRSSDKSVLEIAGSVGYSNGSKFASAFKKVMNKTPAEYRKAAV